MSENDERRIREGLQKLMASRPPNLDPARAGRRSPLWALAMGVGTFAVLFAVLTTALVLNHRTTGGHTPAPAATSSASPTTRPTTTPLPSPTSTPSSFLPPVGPECSAKMLEMRLGQQSGAGGNGITYLIFTDRGGSSCVLHGSPIVQFLDANGRLLRVPSAQASSTGMFPTYPNHGVGLIPIPDQGTPPGPLPEGGIRGQASLPLQYPHDGCANSIAAVRVTLPSGSLTVPMTVPGASTNCTVTMIMVNPFQPAEFMP